ncbi:2-phospho-L-lactate guanylyltransferase [soil metagenome]
MSRNQPVSVIVPFRSLHNGKTRLARVLDDVHREALNHGMLRHVVATSLSVRPEVSVLVVSPDQEALDIMRQLDESILTVLQSPLLPGLNPALEQATQVATGAGSTTVVVLPADLPLIRASDIENLIRRDAPVVVAPDRHRLGTNALMQRLDATRGEFRYQFGQDSYWKHMEESHRLGLDAATAVSLGVSFDLDTPDDLLELGERRVAEVSQIEEAVRCG